MIHGDPESLAGWGLAAEAVARSDAQLRVLPLRTRLGCDGEPPTSLAMLRGWFDEARDDLAREEEDARHVAVHGAVESAEPTPEGAPQASPDAGV